MYELSRRAGAISAVFVIAGIAMAYGVALFGYDLDEELLAMSDEFSIGNGDTKVIADHRSPEPYRICVARTVLCAS